MAKSKVVTSDNPDRTTVVSESGAPEGTLADRQDDRFDVDVSVTASSDKYYLAGAATDLSVGGVFIATAILHPVGTKFDVSLHIDDGEPSVVRAGAVVRWHRSADEGTGPQGVGLQFTEVVDDGAERHKFMDIEAEIRGRSTRFTIPVSAFAAMNWPIEHIGVEAVIEPGLGTKEKARAAIQYLSGPVPQVPFHAISRSCLHASSL